MRSKKKIIILIIISIVTINFALNHSGASERVRNGYYSNEDLINEAIRIQYRWGSKNQLNRIFTDNFIEEIESESSFHKKGIIYIIDKDFLEALKDRDEEKFIVSVRVEDIFGSYIQSITLIKNNDGKYLVSDIQYDI